MEKIEKILSAGISRKRYLQWGFFLVVLKAVLDRLIVMNSSGAAWAFPQALPQHYYFLGENFSAVEGLIDGKGQFGLNLRLLIAALPFMAAGLLLTLRRLNTLRWHPWTLCFFFVPYLQWIFFLLLAALPPDELEAKRHLKGDWIGDRLSNTPLASAVTAIMLVTAFGLLVVTFSVEVLKLYGGFLFVGLPFVLGFLSTTLYMPRRPVTYREAVWIGQLSIGLMGLGLLALAFEGILCLAMAAPIAMFLAWLGSSLAWAIVGPDRQQGLRAGFLLALLLPALVGFESATRSEPTLFAVHSQVEIKASPETVWRIVVAFPELKPPTEALFKMGIAYPTHATIKGQGVGAVRECHFNTGTFVEPISTWDEPHKLAFDVSSQPQPMIEMSPYSHVNAPHLDGFLVSKKGQFELEALPDGGTLLKGTTWYCHSMGPETYWRLWSDEIIRRIHMRVLEHIKAVAENGK